MSWSSQCSISVVGTLLALLVRIIHITLPPSKAAHFLAAQDFYRVEQKESQVEVDSVCEFSVRNFQFAHQQLR